MATARGGLPTRHHRERIGRYASHPNGIHLDDSCEEAIENQQLATTRKLAAARRIRAEALFKRLFVSLP